VRQWHRLPREAVAAPSLGSVQGQVGRGFEQPDLVEGVPVHGRGGWNEVIFKHSSNPARSVTLCF